MELTIKQMEYNEANQIAKWVYKEPYSIYSMNDDESCINELLNGDYFSAMDKENNLIGYYCYGKSAQVPIGRQFGVYDNKDIIDIGLGIKPDLCGQGLGVDFLIKGMDFARNKLGAKGLCLTVAAFNQRAIKVYQRVGFRKVNSFERISEAGRLEFWVMVL